MKDFDINTISILDISKISLIPNIEYYSVKVIGKYVGGKRWKRGKMIINKSQLRQIKLNNVV